MTAAEDVVSSMKEEEKKTLAEKLPVRGRIQQIGQQFVSGPAKARRSRDELGFTWWLAVVVSRLKCRSITGK